MKWLLICTVCVSFLALSCDGENSTDPDENGGEVSPYTGSFSLSNTFSSSDCGFPAEPPPSTISITVTEDVIAFNTTIGTWDDGELRGVATSAQTCIPIPSIHEDCVRCADFTYDIVYADPDSFSGTYTVHYYYSLECGADDCYTVYDIEGVR
jgi:hypothetical protein